MTHKNVQPLSTVASSSKGTVIALRGGGGFKDRVIGMGLPVGAEIEVIHGCSDGAGPVMVAVGDTRLAIGHGMAERILVRVTPK